MGKYRTRTLQKKKKKRRLRIVRVRDGETVEIWLPERVMEENGPNEEGMGLIAEAFTKKALYGDERAEIAKGRIVARGKTKAFVESSVYSGALRFSVSCWVPSGQIIHEENGEVVLTPAGAATVLNHARKVFGKKGVYLSPIGGAADAKEEKEEDLLKLAESILAGGEKEREKGRGEDPQEGLDLIQTLIDDLDPTAIRLQAELARSPEIPFPEAFVASALDGAGGERSLYLPYGDADGSSIETAFIVFPTCIGVLWKKEGDEETSCTIVPKEEEYAEKSAENEEMLTALMTVQIIAIGIDEAHGRKRKDGSVFSFKDAFDRALNNLEIAIYGNIEILSSVSGLNEATSSTFGDHLFFLDYILGKDPTRHFEKVRRADEDLDLGGRFAEACIKKIETWQARLSEIGAGMKARRRSLR